MILLNDFFSIVNQKGRVEDGSLAFDVKLNRNHVIYQAHFPGSPITPGVCMIQLVTECLQIALEKKLSIKQIKNIKFLNTLNPDEVSAISIFFTKVDLSCEGVCSIQSSVRITAGETVYAKMSVINYNTL